MYRAPVPSAEIRLVLGWVYQVPPPGVPGSGVDIQHHGLS